MDTYGKVKRPRMGNAKLYVEWDALGKAPGAGPHSEPCDRLDMPTATVVLVGKQNFPGASNA